MTDAELRHLLELTDPEEQEALADAVGEFLRVEGAQ